MDLRNFVWKNSKRKEKKSGLMNLPKVKAETVESIIEEIYAKNKTFGVREFQSNIGRENTEFFLVMESFIEALADYIAGEEDVQKNDEICAISKIAYHLTYKAISKQMEIDEMNT
jgi:hypothetical protein